MKIVTGILIAVIVALVSGCATPTPVSKSTPAPEPTTQPATSTPVKGKSHQTEPLNYKAHFHVYVYTFTMPPSGWTFVRPTAYVSVKNTDKVQRTFKVQITFYYGVKQYTKEFLLELKPGQIKMVTMTSDDIPDRDFMDSFPDDWAVDYQVTPIP